MTKKLLWIGFIGLAVSAACLGAAGWLNSGGIPLQPATYYRIINLHGEENDSVLLKLDDTQPNTGSLAWDDRQLVKIDFPLTIRYEPGATPSARFSGSTDILKHIRLRNGRLELDQEDLKDALRADDIQLTLVSPLITEWRMNAPGKLVLSNIGQDTLNVNIQGSGSVEAIGSVKQASLFIAGTGTADLKNLRSNHTNAFIVGSGTSEIYASEEADIFMSGSGNISVHGNPPRIRSKAMGSAEIRKIE